MEQIKAQFPWISYGDLWTLGTDTSGLYVWRLADKKVEFAQYRRAAGPRSLGEKAEPTDSSTMIP